MTVQLNPAATAALLQSELDACARLHPRSREAFQQGQAHVANFEFAGKALLGIDPGHRV